MFSSVCKRRQSNCSLFRNPHTSAASLAATGSAGPSALRTATVGSFVLVSNQYIDLPTVGEQKPVIEVMDSCIEVVKKLLANLMLRDADSCRECWHFANGPPAQTAPLAMTYRPNQRPGPIRRYDHLRMTPTVGPDAAPNLRRLLPWTPALRRLPPWLRHFMRPTSSRVNGIRQEGGKVRPVVRRRRTSPDAGRRATRRSGPAPGARHAGGGRQDPVAGTASECSQP